MTEDTPNQQSFEREIGIQTRTGTYLLRGKKYFRVLHTALGPALGEEVSWDEVWRRGANETTPILYKRKPS